MTANMMNGKKVIIICASAFILGFYIKNQSYKKIKENNNNPTLNQYLNRLTEFFDTDTLDVVEDNFLTMVDFGISPRSAFESVIGKK